MRRVGAGGSAMGQTRGSPPRQKDEPVLKMTWRNVFARKVRLALSAFAIVLGVAFLSGAFIFADAMGNAFDGIIEGSTANVEIAYKGAANFDSQEDTRVLSAPVVARLR